jgi:hypothetical protein
MEKYCYPVEVNTRYVISQIAGEGIHRLVAHEARTGPPRLVGVVVHVAVVAVKVAATRHLAQEGIDEGNARGHG